MTNVSEILQRKEQEEEDLFFENLNSEIIEVFHHQAVAGDNSATTRPVQRAKKNLQRPD